MVENVRDNLKKKLKRIMFKELKQELVKNESTTDLRQFNGLALDDTEKFLVYISKSLEMFQNITEIQWPDVCLSPSEEPQQSLMEKIEERLDENRKRSSKNKLDNEVEGKLRKQLRSHGAYFEDVDKSLSRENLIKEIKQYEKFPNDYRHCIFSRHLYMYAGKATDKKDSINKESRVIDEAASNHFKDKFTKLYKDGWRVDQVQIENSFKSILYINERRKQLVLAFKGVQLEIRDLFLAGKCSFTFKK
jgi:hypothetical protein